MCINRIKILLFSIVGILFLGAFSLVQKATETIILRDEKLNFTPAEFHITDVTDDRASHNEVASLIYKDEAHGYVTRPVDLKSGAASAIKVFIDHNLTQNTASRPVTISITQLKLTETHVNGKIDGKLVVEMSFGLQKDYGILKLVDYSGGMHYTRSDVQTDMPESVIRRGIENALMYFNNWINKYAQSDIRLAKAVKIKFTDYTEKPEGDTIYYSVKRPLVWADFQDKPRAGDYEAEVFCGIGYDEHTSVEKGIINLTVEVKVYIPKSASWAKGQRDEHALNHEQRHFDIAKIVAEHFKQKIAAMNLPVSAYEGYINEQYLETLREQNQMQKQYDKETRHGADHAAQEAWNEKIDKELRSLGVK
jgi:hypothetical protein